MSNISKVTRVKNCLFEIDQGAHMQYKRLLHLHNDFLCPAQAKDYYVKDEYRLSIILEFGKLS